MENRNSTASELTDTTDSSVGFSDDHSDEAQNLSDIRDEEVNSYINNEEQMNLKKKIWEMMNKKYLEEQETKKKIAASNVSNPKRKERKITAKNEKKTVEIVAKKRPSSRINHDALRNLFEEEPAPNETPKRARTESQPAKDQDADSELAEYNAAEEDHRWEENPSYTSQYNDQDDDYYYEGEDLF